MRDATSQTFSASFASLPVTLEQSSSRSSPVIFISALVPIVAATALPFILVLAQLTADPAARAVIAERPGAALELVLAASLLLSLFVWPLTRMVRSASERRSVRIDQHAVTAQQKRLFGTSTWSEPLASYSGVTHRVRASLSGTRHEVLLVHADPRRTVLLAVGARISEDEVRRIASVLNVAEISSREASSFALGRAVLGPVAPRPELAVAAL